MRVLHVAQFAGLGGIETYVPGLLAALEDRGHENVVAYSGPEPAGFHTIGRNVEEFPDVTDPSPAAGRQLSQRVLRIVHTSSPDLVFFHAPPNPMLARALLGALPSVYFAHNYGAICASGALFYRREDVVCELAGTPDWRCLVNAYVQQCNTRRPLRLVKLYRFSRRTNEWLRNIDRIVCDSRYVAGRYEANGYPQARLRVLGTPVVLPSLDGVLSTSRERAVLFVGRVTPHKGLDYLMRAVAHIQCRLIVAGDGYALPRMRSLAAELGIAHRVDFLGAVDRLTVDNLYARSAVLAVPSVWPEPWGLVGPEAMAHALPVVAFRVGGIPEWLNDGETGFLVEPKDMAGMAARISDLVDDTMLARRLGENGRAVAEQRFNFERHVDGLLDVFREAIAARSGPAGPAIAISARSQTVT